MAKENKPNFTHFQNIIIHIEGKDSIVATVPAFCATDDELTKLNITKIEMTRPQPLPPGGKFDVISADGEE